MEQSLSILLPVENCQSTLTGVVHELLEVGTELTNLFELIIVDDGSSDLTIEVAEELSLRYPQVRGVRHEQRQGRRAAISTAIRCSVGSVVMLRDVECTIPAHELRRLWTLIDSYDIVLAHAPDLVQSSQEGWQRVDYVNDSGFQLIRRSVIEPIANVLDNKTQLMQTISQRDLRWHEITCGISQEELLEQKASQIAQQIMEGPRNRRTARI